MAKIDSNFVTLNFSINSTSLLSVAAHVLHAHGVSPVEYPASTVKILDTIRSNLKKTYTIIVPLTAILALIATP